MANKETTAKELLALRTSAEAFTVENGTDVVDSIITGASLLGVVTNYKALTEEVKGAKHRKFWRDMDRLATKDPEAYETKLRKVLAKQKELDDADIDAEDDEIIRTHQISLANSVGTAVRTVVGSGVTKLDKVTDIKGVKTVKNVAKGAIGSIKGLFNGLRGKE